MRTLVKRAIVCGLVTAGALGPLTAAEAAQQSEQRLYAPSALVLTVAQGEEATTATPLRAVTLTCSPKPAGTHPAPQQACAELRAVQGRFDQLSNDEQRPCIKIYDPVVVTAQGIWEGRRIDYARTYPNSCVMQSEGESVFAF
ncbi:MULTISPECIES: subtilase-type protease inhibitor [unclassified Streptomyces]|uniref:subtilase-type protease inhibitor n=1 Tax=unclassified Streptomyces TaxID=2593676 RepID=UPI0004C4E3AC|nr:subtilase-type protease inhibitor [Streptomyces sp. NRRL S-118]